MEDEDLSRKALVMLLRSCGYRVSSAASAEEGLRLIRRGDTPKYALVDLDLPGMNGLEFIEHMEAVTQDAPPSHHPVPILITATSRERVESIAADKHVRYLRKPLDFPKLLMLLTENQPHN